MLGVSETPVLNTYRKAQRSQRLSWVIRKSLMGLLMEIWEICHQDLIDGYVLLLVFD